MPGKEKLVTIKYGEICPHLVKTGGVGDVISFDLTRQSTAFSRCPVGGKSVDTEVVDQRDLPQGNWECHVKVKCSGCVYQSAFAKTVLY